jgi:hypothetical protein
MPFACSVSYSCLKNIKTLCNALCTSAWTTLYCVNYVFLFVNILINLVLSCNTNAKKHTSISQWLVDSRKCVSGLYSAIWKTLLAFNYGMNCITITETLYISHTHILCNEKCKWHIESNRYTKTRIPTGLHVPYSMSLVLPPTPHYYKIIIIIGMILF